MWSGVCAHVLFDMCGFWCMVCGSDLCTRRALENVHTSFIAMEGMCAVCLTNGSKQARTCSGMQKDLLSRTVPADPLQSRQGCLWS